MYNQSQVDRHRLVELVALQFKSYCIKQCKTGLGLGCILTAYSCPGLLVFETNKQTNKTKIYKEKGGGKKGNIFCNCYFQYSEGYFFLCPILDHDVYRG